MAVDDSQHPSIAVMLLCLIEEDIQYDELKKERQQKRHATQRMRRQIERGCFSTLVKELELEDPLTYKNWLRMDSESFYHLLELIKDDIKKKDTVMTESITPAGRLVITLRYLTTGISFRDLAHLFHVGERTVSYIIGDTCQALHQCLLAGGVFAPPQTPEAWEAVAKGFEERHQLPNCVGALDGRHVVMRKPVSVALFALVDADLRFVRVDVGTQARLTDTDVWSKCQLKQDLDHNLLGLPPPRELPAQLHKVPYTVVTDDKFGLETYLQSPFPGDYLGEEERVYNYRLHGARMTAESAFGVMTARFQIFRQPIRLTPTKTRDLILAACALHNFILSRPAARNHYTPAGFLDYQDLNTGQVVPGAWRSQNLSGNMIPTVTDRPTNFSMDAKAIRNEFMDYFISVQRAAYWPWSHLT